MLPHKKYFAKSGINAALSHVCNQNAILPEGNIRLLPLAAIKCSFSGGFTITPKIMRILQSCIKNESKIFKK